MRARTVFALLFAAAVTRAADPAIEKLFHDAQDKVLKNVRSVPRYTCVQNIARTQYPPRNPGRQPSCQELIAARKRLGVPANIASRDRLRLAVAVADGKEMFSWAGDGRFDTDRLETLVPGGASGSGGFVGFMASVFGGDAKTVNYTGLTEDLARFEFTVPEERSHYSYQSSGKGDRIIGYTGYFLLDPDSAELNRLVIDSEPLPAPEPACQVENEMDYQRVHIGSGDFLLPEVATMDVIYRNGLEASNETRYSDCHEFSGESTVIFDDLDTSDTKAAAAGKGLPPLPPKTHLRIALAAPILGDSAAAGDAIAGVVVESVRDRVRGIVAYQGDHVYGRIIRMEEDLLPSPKWVVALQFDTIEHAGVRQPVKLESLAPGGVFTFPASGLYAGTKPVVDQSFRSDWETR